MTDAIHTASQDSQPCTHTAWLANPNPNPTKLATRLDG